jgi:hypothetical protein
MTEAVFTTLATSTIAMSTYSVLAMAGESVSLSVLYGTVCKGHEHTIPTEAFARALEGLLQRGLVQEVGDQLYQAKGPRGEPVRWRARGGDGWEGWQVRGQDGRPVALSEVIQ